MTFEKFTVRYCRWAYLMKPRTRIWLIRLLCVLAGALIGSIAAMFSPPLARVMVAFLITFTSSLGLMIIIHWLLK